MSSQLEEALASLRTRGGFATTVRVAADDFSVSVRNRDLRLPIDSTTAKRLVKAAHRAKYGKGTQTLLDTSVRDTWEIDASDVQLTGRALIDAALTRVRDSLGLAEACTLEARLHNLLVYERGQFFAPHQDTEKHDGMIGTLLVILPSRDSAGGELVVSHGGKRETFTGHDRRLTLVAFYADCRHEVKPLVRGHRLVLTFNLIARGESGLRAPLAERQSHALKRAINAHFQTSRENWGKPRPPPDRLVYLLEHEYTQRGLSWARLKNGDGMRSEALRKMADELDLEVSLAQADVHETWQCEPNYGGRGASRTPIELIETGVTLLRLVRENGEAEDVENAVDRDELVQLGDGRDLKPYRSEYEGYQGNWGDTEDRWYHRGAVVLSPRARAFAIRAKESPKWAIDEVVKTQRQGDLTSANRMVSELLPRWAESAVDGSVLGAALKMAAGTRDPSLAKRVTAPFGVAALEARMAPALTEFIEGFAEDARQACAHWFDVKRYGYQHAEWVPKLPELLRGLPAAHGFVRALVQAQLDWLSPLIGEKVAPGHARQVLKHLKSPAVAVIECAAIVGEAFRLGVFELLEPGSDPARVQWFAEVLTGVRGRLSKSESAAIGLDDLRAGVARELRAHLEVPQRAPDDWSIRLESSCKCELCAVLRKFLADPAQTVLEWPLAEQRRRHVHGVIEAQALPVTHETRRTGRPLTLVLTKERALFENERELRAQLKRTIKQLES